MNLSKPLFLSLCLVLGSACDRGDTAIGGFDSDGCDSAGTDDGGAMAVALAVDCSFYYLGVQQSARFPASDELGGGTPTTVEIGDTIKAIGILSDSEYEGRSFSIRITSADEAMIASILYQMDRTRHPANEFLGDHGFTGLHYVRDPANGETLQYGCFASDPADPIHEWEN
jgi:hypothetical protein